MARSGVPHGVGKIPVLYRLSREARAISRCRGAARCRSSPRTKKRETNGKLRGPFLPLRGEPHGFRFSARRPADDKQAPGLEGVPTMTDMALVPCQGPHQVLMTARDHAASALMVRRQPA